jgi:putative spermidine/putrescine transport system substrate-binding protein
MDSLVKAAQKEGTLNLLTVPRDWANYGELIDLFTKAFGIKINSQNPDGSSADEINAIQTAPASKKPDMFDGGLTYAKDNESLFTDYKVQTFKDIPDTYKNPDGLWQSNYAGQIVLMYPKGLPKTPTTIAGLTDPAFKGMVALAGNPTSAQQSLMSVFAVNQAAGGTPADITPAVKWFQTMKSNGNFVTVPGTAANFAAGAFKILFNWSFNCPGNIESFKKSGVDMICAVPTDSQLVGTPYVAAIPKAAPHPAAARLWEELLYSQNNKGYLTATLPSVKGKSGSAIFKSLMGGQNIWVSGGAAVTEAAAMSAKGILNNPPTQYIINAPGKAVTPTAAQQDAAKTLLNAQWPAIIGN